MKLAVTHWCVLMKISGCQSLGFTKKHLQNIDRRSTGGGRKAKGIMADKSWDRWLKQYWHDKYNPKPKKKRVVKIIRKDYMSTKEAFRLAYNEYDKFGYQSALDLLQKLYTEDKISLADLILPQLN